MRLYEVVALLHTHGFTPAKIARVVYGENWDKLSPTTKQKLVRRVKALLRYWKNKSQKFYNQHEAVFITNEFYNQSGSDVLYVENENDGEDPQIDYSGGVREDRQHSPSTDGTLTVRDRKLLAVRDVDRWFVEYEQLLYLLYKKVASRYDDPTKMLWSAIKAIHIGAFNNYFERYSSVKGTKSSGKKVKIPEQAAAYAYLVFFAALHRFPSFNAIRYSLLQTIKQMIGDIDKFIWYVQELLPLFVKSFI